MEAGLRRLFEEQLSFRLADGMEIEGSIYLGSAELFPVETLLCDPAAYADAFENWLKDDWRPTQQEIRDEILRYAANEKRYLDLQDAVARLQVIPFIGSGMSVPSGLPTWSDFLCKVGAFAKCSPEEVEELIRESRFEEAADLLASRTNRRLLAERVEHDLRIDDVQSITGAIRLLPDLFGATVITTNLDDLLERLYRACDRPFQHVLYGTQLTRFRQIGGGAVQSLLKLHGDRRTSEGRILLSREYEAAYAPGSDVREELSLLCRSHSLLFLGCSLGPDRTVALVEAVARTDRAMPKHFCFCERPSDEEARVDRENFLTDRGIYPIWYGRVHDEALTALLDGLYLARESYG